MKRIWLLGMIFTLVVGMLAFGQVKTLYWNLGTEPPTLDPNIATDTTSVQIDQALFLGLTDFDDNTMEVVPELATHWEASEDGLTWTFYMRDDVYWTNGRKVTAHDVEYSVKRTLDPATGSSYAYVLWIIKGAEAFNDNQGARPTRSVSRRSTTTRFSSPSTSPRGTSPPSPGCGSAARSLWKSLRSTVIPGQSLSTSSPTGRTSSVSGCTMIT